MSDERQTEAAGGAPLEETEASTTELRAAVDRAREGEAAEPGVPEPVPAFEMPSAATAAEPAAEAEAALVLGGELTAESAVDEDTLVSAVAPAEPLLTGPEPSTPVAAPAAEPEIRVAADHPMAPLYVQTPAPPELRGNRGIGILIALLATLGFAAVYAGVIAITLAPTHSPSRFVPALLEHVLAPVFLIPVAAFFLALALTVVIVNRAGWWAYVLGGFLVGVVVWAAATGGALLSPAITGLSRSEARADLLGLALTPLPLIAGVVAREATVWFGAWIGARGRRVKTRNQAALAAYEEQVAETQAGLPAIR